MRRSLILLTALAVISQTRDLRTPSLSADSTQPDGAPSGPKAEEMIRAAFERGVNRFDWTHCRKAGEPVPVEVILTPMELDGKQVRIEKKRRWFG